MFYLLVAFLVMFVILIVMLMYCCPCSPYDLRPSSCAGSSTDSRIASTRSPNPPCQVPTRDS
jgi:hypothetical protein